MDFDFYNSGEEYSDFDRQIDEFKDGLKSTVKKEFLEKMEFLEKENKELEKIKIDWTKLENDYIRKNNQLERERLDLKSETKRMRLSELMEDMQLVLYKVTSKYTEKPKCNKCNNSRKIPYISSQGKTIEGYCECNNKIVTYFPEKNVLYSFRLDNSDKKFKLWYKKKIYDDKNEYFEGDSWYFSGEPSDGNYNYEEVNRYLSYFKSKEECQKYCDWLNSKE